MVTGEMGGEVLVKRESGAREGCTGVFPNLSRSHPNCPPPDLKTFLLSFL